MQDIEQLINKLLIEVEALRQQINNQPQPQKFYSVKEVAAILGVGTTTVNRLINMGHLEFTQSTAGGFVRISQNQLNKYTNKNYE